MMEEWGTSWSITLVGLRKEGLDCPKKKNVSVCFFKVDRIAKSFSSLISTKGDREVRLVCSAA